MTSKERFVCAAQFALLAVPGWDSKTDKAARSCARTALGLIDKLSESDFRLSEAGHGGRVYERTDMEYIRGRLESIAAHE